MLKTLLLVGVVTSAVVSSKAVAISGEILFSGNLVRNGTSYLDATAITAFNNVETIGVSSGAYAPIPANTPGTINPFTFVGVGTVTEPAPPLTLWTLTSGGVLYSFQLNSVGYDAVPTATSLALHGSGIARIQDATTLADLFDPTAGVWDLQAGTVGNFHFSAGTTVPDGGATAMLIGVGVLGLGALRRKL